MDNFILDPSLLAQDCTSRLAGEVWNLNDVQEKTGEEKTEEILLEPTAESEEP